MGPRRESTYWYRVAALRPVLRAHVRAHRHHYRGERWHVLEDPVSGRFHRLRPAAWTLVAAMDGTRDLEAIWRGAVASLGDEAPSQDDTIALLAHLHAADLLRADVTPDGDEIFARFARDQSARAQGRWRNPLSLRVALLDPDRLLERLRPWYQPAFGRAGFAAWLATVAIGVVLAAVHARELHHAATHGALAPERLVALLLVYPFVKTLHELGHACATKAWGGAVHELGLTLLLFLPVPYVDASSASAFREKRRRMIVGAAGVMVELFVAAVAMVVWVSVEPGLVRTLAWDAMVIGGVSTVVWNGNPLLRFDGYYVLCDALEIPNLGARSFRALGALLERAVLGLPEDDDRAERAGERAWLVLYGLASFAYRAVLVVSISLFLAERFFFVGVLLAVSMLATQVAAPGVKALARLRDDPRLRRRPWRSAGGLGAAIAAALLLVFVVPLPSWTIADGVVWPPDDIQVRARVDGFVSRVLVEPGAWVEAGAPLVETEDPEQTARVRTLAARLRELEARREAELVTDLVQSQVLAEQVRTAAAELARARSQAEDAVLRSPLRGRVVLPNAENLPGRFVHRGDLLGWVTDLRETSVRAVVPGSDVARVRERTLGVRARLAHAPEQEVAARIRREVPAGDVHLPSLAFGSVGGGRVAVDAQDREGLTATERVFQFDVVLDGASAPGIGERVHLRFDHDRETIAARTARAARRLFLSRLGV